MRLQLALSDLDEEYRADADQNPDAAGRDDPPGRVDAVEAAMQDALRQRRVCAHTADSAAAGPGPGPR